MPATPVTPLDSRRTINGRNGKVFLAGGIFLAQVQSIEARPVLERSDVVVSGRLQTGYKLTGASGTGTLNGFHTTSKFRKLIADVFNTGVMPPPTYLTMELSDPDQFRVGQLGITGDASIERCILREVNFWEAPAGFDTGALVMDDIPFTFEGIEYPDVIAPPGIDF